MKTNAARILDDMQILYQLRDYPVDEQDLGAEAVAAKIGCPPEQVFKTLVLRGDKQGVCMACIPGNGSLDLKALAAASHNKKVEMVALKEVQPLTGYIRGGVSPLGAKKHYPVFLDHSALQWPHILISAGLRGLQILIAPADLLKAVAAQSCAITRSQ